MESKKMQGFSQYTIYEDSTIVKSGGRVVAHRPRGDKGYMDVMLRNDEGEVKRMAVHRVIAHVFHGFDLSNYELEPDHKDRNPSNNHKDNLEVVTRAENIRRSKGHRPWSVTDTHKECSNCMQMIHRSDFHPSTRNKDRLRGRCKTCSRVRKL